MSLSMIIAVSDDGVIGMGGKLPWKLKTDMEIFRRLTMGKNVVMGRKTFESIGLPLEGRGNIVITSNRQWRFPFDVNVFYSFTGLIGYIQGREIRKRKMPIIIGGRQLYLECLNAGIIDTIYLTRVHENIGELYRLRKLTRMSDEDMRLSEFKIDGVEHHYPASEKDEYPFTFSKLIRA